MKKSLILLIILLFSCQGSDWGEIRYTYSKTNVRILKSTSSKIVTTLQPNQKIKVIVSEYDWWLVYDLNEKKSKEKCTWLCPQIIIAFYACSTKGSSKETSRNKITHTQNSSR